MELISIEEIAGRLIEFSKDMDFADYAENEEQIKNDLINSLCQLRTMAQNEYNSNYWRTLYEVLQRI